MPPYGCDSLALAAALPLYNTGPVCGVQAGLHAAPGLNPAPLHIIRARTDIVPVTKHAGS